MRNRGRPSIDDFTKRKVIDLYENTALTTAEISKRTGVSRTSIWRIVKEYEVDKGLGNWSKYDIIKERRK